jgi:hypothetical protein
MKACLTAGMLASQKAAKKAHRMVVRMEASKLAR